MQPDEALDLAQRCLPRFAQAGLPAAPTITKVRAKRMCGLWAGMGAVYELVVSADGVADFAIVAKRISLPKNCSSIGDRRKKDSYDCEAAFYACGGGFAECGLEVSGLWLEPEGSHGKCSSLTITLEEVTSFLPTRTS